MKDPFLEIPEILDEGKKVVLARIIRQMGSAPRSVGTRCLILEDGSLLGTIGGGRLEHEVHERAKALVRDGQSTILHFQLTGEDVAKTEMLCGGIVDVYLEPLWPQDGVARDLFGKVKGLLGGGQKGALLTLVAEGLRWGDQGCRLLVTEEGAVVGGIPQMAESPEGRNLGGFLGIRRPELAELGEGGPLLFAEPIAPEDVLYVFGAGHISTYVAPLARMVGFRVVVIDDREEFANSERFSSADECLVLPFPEAFGHISVSGSSYLAIVTRGHIHDTTVLRAALERDVAYIGMIGSRRKRDVVYQALMEEGVPKERFAQVHSPIGLDIGGETPEEIAVSIVAELIQVRAARQRQRPL